MGLTIAVWVRALSMCQLIVNYRDYETVGVKVSMMLWLQGYSWLKDRILGEEGRRQQMQLRELGLIAEQIGCSLAQLAIGQKLVEVVAYRTTRTHWPWRLVIGYCGRVVLLLLLLLIVVIIIIISHTHYYKLIFVLFPPEQSLLSPVHVLCSLN